jgi:hypothetical protein
MGGRTDVLVLVMVIESVDTRRTQVVGVSTRRAPVIVETCGRHGRSSIGVFLEGDLKPVVAPKDIIPADQPNRSKTFHGGVVSNLQPRMNMFRSLVQFRTVKATQGVPGGAASARTWSV